MSHSHVHARRSYNRAFAWGVIVNLAFVACEAFYGWVADSLALIADAGHNLSDVLGLLLAWGANLLAARRPSQRRTYGFRRATILASLLSAVSLLVALGAIAWEAIRRFAEPKPVHEMVVIAVAAIGVVVNASSALMFSSGRKHDLNVRGAFLHMAADAAVSLGVVIAGTVILFTGWIWLDPAVSLLIAAVILIGTWELLRESVNLAFDAVPKGIDPMHVKAYLNSVPGVSHIHDLHIWGMSTTEVALTAHLVIPRRHVDDAFLYRITDELHQRFGIDHSTLQIERGDSAVPCNQEPDDRV